MGIRRIVDRVWARVRAWTGTKAPLDPSDFVATRSDEDTIALSWTDNSDNETGFLIERKTGSGSYSNLTTAAADATSYTDDTAYPGYAYTYQLSAFNLTGSSNTVTSEEVTMPLTAPATVTATQFTANTINVSWTDSSGYESGWRIQRSNAGAAFAALTNVSAGTTTYQDTTAAVGYNYQYQVATINATSSANSAYTQSVVVTPTYLYGYPTAQAAEPNVQVQWLFDEASGNCVDEIQGLSVSLRVGNATYNTAISNSYWAPVSPGVKYLVDITRQYMWNTSLTTQLDVGATENITFETIFELYNVNASATIINEGAAGLYLNLGSVSGKTRVTAVVISTDATTVSKSFDITLLSNDTPYKLRWTINKGGNSEIFINGVSLGTWDTSALNNKAIEPTRVVIGGPYSSVNAMSGTLFEIRKSLNLLNNSGGPGGG